MAADLLIRNGTVIDPARKVHAVGDVAIAGGRIVEADGTGATTEIDAAGQFYFAEDYHQQYLAKNPAGYCGVGGTGVSCPIGVGVRA